MKEIAQLRNNKRKLFMEFQNLNPNTNEGLARRRQIKAELEAIDKEIMAIAECLGNKQDEPRIMRYKNREHGKRPH